MISRNILRSWQNFKIPNSWNAEIFLLFINVTLQLFLKKSFAPYSLLKNDLQKEKKMKNTSKELFCLEIIKKKLFFVWKKTDTSSVIFHCYHA